MSSLLGPQVPELPAMVRSIRKQFTGSESYRFRDMVQDRLAEELRKHPVLLTVRDKVSFFLGVLNLVVTEAMLLLYPAQFHYLYYWWFPVLMGYRTVVYANWGYHLFLLDFCYFVNLSVFAFLLFFRDSPLVFAVAFVCSVGPVVCAVPAWRISLVFHDLEKMTSIFIHLYPPLVMYAWRFLIPRTECGEEDMPDGGWEFLPLELAQKADGSGKCWPPLSHLALACAGLGFYLCWQFMYCVVVEWGLWGVMQRNQDLQTSRRWFVGAKSGILYDIARAVVIRVGLLSKDEHFVLDSSLALCTFISSQLVFTLITMIPPILFFPSFYLTTAWLSIVGLDAIWNGATYYIDVFARKYIAKVQDVLNAIKARAKTSPKLRPQEGGSVEEMPEEETRATTPTSPRKKKV